MKLGLATLVLVALEARASAGPSAEQLHVEAQRDYDNGAYATAIAKWTRSYELSGVHGLLFNLAQAQRLDGNCTQALANYKRFLELDPDADPEKRAQADDFVAELEPTCGRGWIVESPRVERPSTRPGRTLKIAGLATGGAGIVLLTTGLLFGHRASTLGDEVTRACAAPEGCDWDKQQDKDARGRRYATTGYVLDAIGVAAIAAGAITYYLGDRKDRITVVPRSDADGVVVTWSGLW